MVVEENRKEKEMIKMGEKRAKSFQNKVIRVRRMICKKVLDRGITKKCGMISGKKTKVMVISRQGGGVVTITLNGKRIKQEERFC